jgi:hypothetical protein
MGKTVDDWEVGGALSVAGATALTGNTTLAGNFSAGTGTAGYLATYNWLELDGDGFKTYGLKWWDYGTDAYRLGYVRNGFFEGEGVTGLASTNVVRPAFPGAKIGFTIEGGYAIQLINDTGAASVKGTIVEACNESGAGADNVFTIEDADDNHPIGAVYENGIPDGGLCWVVVGGIAEVLLEDSTAATRGYWVRVSTNQAGRVDITNQAPPGGTIQALETHFQEMGHCLESKGAGTDVLCKIVMHFN